MRTYDARFPRYALRNRLMFFCRLLSLAVGRGSSALSTFFARRTQRVKEIPCAPKGEGQVPLSTLIPHMLLGKLTSFKIIMTKENLLKQNRNFRPKSEGRSGHRPLLPKRKLNILVDLTLGKSYHSVVTFLHAQKIKSYTFSIQTSSKLISYYVCPWKVGP